MSFGKILQLVRRVKYRRKRLNEVYHDLLKILDLHEESLLDELNYQGKTFKIEDEGQVVPIGEFARELKKARIATGLSQVMEYKKAFKIAEELYKQDLEEAKRIWDSNSNLRKQFTKLMKEMLVQNPNLDVLKKYEVFDAIKILSTFAIFYILSEKCGYDEDITFYYKFMLNEKLKDLREINPLTVSRAADFVAQVYRLNQQEFREEVRKKLESLTL